MDRRQQEYYKECLNLSLPKIYSTLNFNILNFFSLFWENHPIKRSFSPIIHFDIVINLLTTFIAICFLCSIIFDHFVSIFGSELACKKRTSIFTCSKNEDDISCFWDASKQLCTTKYSNIDADNIIWFALFLSVIGIPVSYFIGFCNYSLFLLITTNFETTKSKIVIISNETLKNPRSSTNRIISYDKHLFTSILHQEFLLFYSKLKDDINHYNIFQSVWMKILNDFISSSLPPPPLPSHYLLKDDIESLNKKNLTSSTTIANTTKNNGDIQVKFNSHTSPISKNNKNKNNDDDDSINNVDNNLFNNLDRVILNEEKRFSMTETDIKKMLSLSIQRAKLEIQKQIALETRILGSPRESTIKPQDIPRSELSMSLLRHQPGAPVLNHYIPPSSTHETSPPHPYSKIPTATIRTSRKYCDDVRIARHVFLLFRDFLSYDSRMMLDFQLYIRSQFTSKFADPYLEFHDIVHSEYQQWRIRPIYKYMILTSYCIFVIFMLFYTILFIISSFVVNKYYLLLSAISTVGLWIVFTGGVIQPLITLFSQYIIPKMISHDVHAARRCCLTILKDHYFQNQVSIEFEKELLLLSQKQSNNNNHHLHHNYNNNNNINNNIDNNNNNNNTQELPNQLLFSSQRFGSEYSEFLESLLIEKYRPLSSLSYPLLQLYILPPYSLEMMRLLVDVEQLEIDYHLERENVSNSMKAYWLSQPPSIESQTIANGSARPVGGISGDINNQNDDDQDRTIIDRELSHEIPLTTARTWLSNNQLNNVNIHQPCLALLVNQRIQKEKQIVQLLQHKVHLSYKFTLRFIIAFLIRCYYNSTKGLTTSSNSKSSIVTFGAIDFLIKFLLVIFVVFLVQFHETLYLIHPILALAPVVLFGWSCVVYYFIVHTSRNDSITSSHSHTTICRCLDRREVTAVSLPIILQCGCGDCQFSNSHGLEVNCDYCHIRPPKIIQFDSNILEDFIKKPNFHEDIILSSQPKFHPLNSLSNNNNNNNNDYNNKNSPEKKLIGDSLSVSSPSELSYHNSENVSPDYNSSSKQYQSPIEVGHFSDDEDDNDNDNDEENEDENSEIRYLTHDSNGKDEVDTFNNNSSHNHNDNMCYHSNSDDDSNEDESRIVIRLPGQKEVIDIGDEHKLQQWIKQHSKHQLNEWNENNIPLPPVPFVKVHSNQPLQEKLNGDDDNNNDEGDDNNSSTNQGEIQRTNSSIISTGGLQLYPTDTTLTLINHHYKFEQSSPQQYQSQSPQPHIDQDRNINKLLKVSELHESYQSDQMSLYRDLILNKTIAKINLKNRRTKNENKNEESKVVKNKLKKRLMNNIKNEDENNNNKDNNNDNNNDDDNNNDNNANSSNERKFEESKLKSRYVLNDFEISTQNLHENRNKEKNRSQEILSKRLQEKKNSRIEG